MSTKALMDYNHEIIKAHVLSPEDSPLPVAQQQLFDRAIAMAKILSKNPVVKNAIALHRRLYPEISLKTAYRDYHLSLQLFQSLQTFDFDSWNTFMLNDIALSIQKLRKHNTVAALKVIAMEHANLKKVVGDKPEDLPDPERNEKHQFYILIQNDYGQTKVDINSLKDLPVTVLSELNRAIWGGQEITETIAEEIMNT